MTNIINWMKMSFTNMYEILKRNIKIESVMACLLLMSITMIACNMEKIVESDNKETKKQEHKPFSGYTIVIDPGHGGIDPGKIGINDALEKNINLSISLYIEEILKNTGAKVVLTRESDTGLYQESDGNKKRADMENRCEIINKEYLKNEKTIVVSVHQNSFTSENVKGAQVFYYRNSAGGTELAKIMQTILNDNININNKKEIKENTSYYMLLHTKCPTIIVECGFLSNWDDANNLSSDDYQKRMAGLICKGIEEYLKK